MLALSILLTGTLLNNDWSLGFEKASMLCITSTNTVVASTAEVNNLHAQNTSRVVIKY